MYSTRHVHDINVHDMYTTLIYLMYMTYTRYLHDINVHDMYTTSSSTQYLHDIYTTLPSKLKLM
jgi:hypothetical protein